MEFGAVPGRTSLSPARKNNNKSWVAGCVWVREQSTIMHTYVHAYTFTVCIVVCILLLEYLGGMDNMHSVLQSSMHSTNMHTTTRLLASSTIAQSTTTRVLYAYYYQLEYAYSYSYSSSTSVLLQLQYAYYAYYQGVHKQVSIRESKYLQKREPAGHAVEFLPFRPIHRFVLCMRSTVRIYWSSIPHESIISVSIHTLARVTVLYA